MTVDTPMFATDRLAAVTEWYQGVMRLPRTLRGRHVVIVHSIKCYRNKRTECECTPLIVRAVGGAAS